MIKIIQSHFGPEGPRNIGMLIRMNEVAVIFYFWKWYLEIKVKKSET